MASPPFHFKRFRVDQTGVAHPVGTDSVLLGAWTGLRDARHILDIGTGTGIVALMLAQRSEHQPALVDAVEIHSESARCAQNNFAHSPWASHLQVWNCAVQDFAEKPGRQYDLIVSNPPYFTETVVSPDALRRLGRTASALTPSDLLHAIRRLMAPSGRSCVILPLVEGRRFCELAALQGLYCTAETAVCARAGKPVERLLLQLEYNPYAFRRSELVVYAEGEQYTLEFQELTKDFYLDRRV